MGKNYHILFIIRGAHSKHSSSDSIPNYKVRLTIHVEWSALCSTSDFWVRNGKDIRCYLFFMYVFCLCSVIPFTLINQYHG